MATNRAPRTSRNTWVFVLNTYLLFSGLVASEELGLNQKREIEDEIMRSLFVERRGHDTECSDTIASCDKWSSPLYDFCNHNSMSYSYMARVCKLTCGLCSSTTSAPEMRTDTAEIQRHAVTHGE